jgi:GT2 family glycosyltransferase
MVGQACRPGVGAVGAKLLFADGTVQHGGVVVGVHGVAEHAFTGLPAAAAGYQLRARLTQNYSAVTGACLVCRREAFDAVGGFDMVKLRVALNDVDFCLRLVEAGYRNVWTPYARLYHLAGQSRGEDSGGEKRQRLDAEIAYMKERWPAVLQRDPCHNPAFERYEHPFSMLSSAAYPPVPDKAPQRGRTAAMP